MSLGRWTLTWAALLVVAGCEDGYQHDPSAYFPEDWATIYVQLTACEATEDHSGPYHTAWVAPVAEQASVVGSGYPEGSVLMAPQYLDSACRDLDLIVAMQRRSAAAGGWDWQLVYADGAIAHSGPDTFCQGCHQSSCAERRLVCTVP